MSSMVKNKKAQNLLLLTALGLLVCAALLKAYIAKNNPYDDIISLLASYGYTAREEDIFVEGRHEGTTIQALLQNVDLSPAVEASRSNGFPSRIDKTGDVVLLLLATKDEEIVTLYYLDGEPELCFVQAASSREVKPLGKEEQ